MFTQDNNLFALLRKLGYRESELRVEDYDLDIANVLERKTNSSQTLIRDYEFIPKKKWVVCFFESDNDVIRGYAFRRTKEVCGWKMKTDFCFSSDISTEEARQLLFSVNWTVRYVDSYQ